VDVTAIDQVLNAGDSTHVAFHVSNTGDGDLEIVTVEQIGFIRQPPIQVQIIRMRGSLAAKPVGQLTLD